MKPTPTPDQLRPWPFHGYAPGGYLCTCRICSVSFQGDKRAMACLSCAVVEAKKELAADLLAAPEGWRQSLEKIAAMRWHEDADLDDICTIADRALSAALSVPAAAVVGEPAIEYAEWLEACATNEPSQSDAEKLWTCAQLIRTLASRISQQDAELERVRRELAEANEKIAKTRDLIAWAQSDLIAEARKQAFFQGWEMSETGGMEDTCADAWAFWSLMEDGRDEVEPDRYSRRAKAEETPHE